MNSKIELELSPDDRFKKKFEIGETFGIDLGAGVKKDILGFSSPTPLTPDIDPTYVFPVEATKALLLGTQLKDNVLITGATGVGKSSLVQQVAARLNYGLIRINLDGGTSKQDLIGEWTVKNKETVFQYGLLTKAMQLPGTIILLDEWDSMNGECAFVLQGLLERDNKKLMVLETGGELISMHPDNLIVATANTKGQGDDTGLYSQGTKVQNYAQLNRFSMTIHMDYLSDKDELSILLKKFPEVKEDLLTLFVDAIKALRTGYKNGEIFVPLSTRDLINWIEKFTYFGKAIKAANYAFLNRMTENDAQTSKGVIQRSLGVSE